MNQITAYLNEQLHTCYPPEEIRSFIRIILEKICGLSYHQQILCKDSQIPINEKKQIEAIVDRLKLMEPLQYILNETEFYSIPLKVNPCVLIPRPETEELVDMIIKSAFVKSYSRQTPFRMLDIGTGSGCIAIALSKHIPGTSVTAVDISEDALQTAAKNAQLNGVSVCFVQADILNTQTFISLFPEQFDLIVSNPPYIKTDEKHTLSAHVIANEPHIALFVPSTEPILFYEAIAHFALQKLRPDGMMFFEINPLCDTLISDMLHTKGFMQTEVIRDLSGKNRFITAKKS